MIYNKRQYFSNNQLLFLSDGCGAVGYATEYCQKATRFAEFAAD